MTLDFRSIAGRAQTRTMPIGLFVDSELRSINSDDKIILDPPFQRGSVWSVGQKMRFIESILVGIPLPTIFVNRWPEARPHPVHQWQDVMVDGKQRFEAVAGFMEDKFEVDGELWSRQTDGFRRCFRMTQGLCMIIYTQFETMKECAELYLKLLKAGTAHTPEEIALAEEFVRSTDI